MSEETQMFFVKKPGACVACRRKDVKHYSKGRCEKCHYHNYHYERKKLVVDKKTKVKKQP